MDPLSITAGIIAILGAATTTTSTLSKLRAAGKAPELFDELSNEVEALRSVLVLVRVCLRGVQHSEFEQDVHESLGGLLQDTSNVALELQSMLEFQLRAGEGRTKKGRAKVNRRDWMKHEPEVERIKQKIRDARDNLQTGLTALSVIQGDITRQLVVQIQGIHISQQDRLPAALSSSQQQAFVSYEASKMVQYPEPGPMNHNHLLPHTTQLSQQDCTASTSSRQAQHALSQDEDLATSDPAHTRNDVTPIPEHQDRSSTHAARNDLTLSSIFAQPPSLDTMTVTATVARRPCNVSCDCACHVRTSGSTPGWLKGVLGQLMFNYTQTICTRPCTKDSCLKSSHKSTFLYRFPSWLARKTLELQHHPSGLASYGNTCNIRLNLNLSIYDHLHDKHQVVGLEHTRNVGPMLFLTGLQTPEWINAVGVGFDLDPRFFHNHLDTKSSNRRNLSSMPAMPSADESILRLQYFTLGEHHGLPGGTTTTELRSSSSTAMEEFTKALSGKWHNSKQGDSIVRRHYVHSLKYYSIMQQMTIAVQCTRNGFKGFAWIDSGFDLGPGPDGSWSKRERGSILSFLPRTLNSPRTALESSCRASLRKASGLSTSLASICKNYGRSLNDELIFEDAFYAITELLQYAAFSICQYLNLIKYTIQDATRFATSRAGNCDVSDLAYHRQLLDDVIPVLEENLRAVEARGYATWPRAARGAHLDKTNRVAISLLADYRELLSRAQTLAEQCSSDMRSIMHQAASQEAQQMRLPV